MTKKNVMVAVAVLVGVGAAYWLYTSSKNRKAWSPSGADIDSINDLFDSPYVDEVVKSTIGPVTITEKKSWNSMSTSYRVPE